MPGDHLFSYAEVLRFDFTLAADKWQELQEHGNAEEYVQAALELGSDNVSAQAFATVGLRHKGSWTLHHCWDDNGGVRSYIGECA